MRTSAFILVSLSIVLATSFSACRAPDELEGVAPASAREAAPVSTPTTDEEPAPAAVEEHPIGPEMAQLERDLRSEPYRAMILGFTNFNDLNGEMNRLDLPDSPARFAARQGGMERVRADPQLLEAYEKRRAIEEEFLELLSSAYRKIGRERLFDQELARVRREIDASLVREEGDDRVDPAAPASIEPILPAPDAHRHWPRWRGPSGQGLSAEKGVPIEWGPEKNVEWKTPIPGRGNSSPVIWGDRIFLTTAFEGEGRRAIVCVSRSTGEILWMKDAPAASLEKKFIEKNSWASATPVVDGERVIAFLGNGGIVAYDLAGTLLWHYPMPWFDGSHGTGASPAVAGEVVLLVQEHNQGASIAVGVDRRSGEEIWKRELDPALGWCSVLPLRVNGRDEVVLGVHGRVIGLDPATGKELWSADGPTKEVVPTLVYGHGLVYSCSGRNGPTLAVKPGGEGEVTETHVAWRSVRGAPHVPSPILLGGLLYYTNDTGILSCLDALSGSTVYQKRLRGKFTASPVAADGKIYFTNEDGVTFVVREGRDFETLAENEFGETTLASMAVLDGRLYARSEGHLWALREGASLATAGDGAAAGN